MKTRYGVAIAIVFAALAPQSANAAATIVIHHAKVITVDKSFSTAEAIAIDGKRIVKVGTNDECLALAGPTTRKIDAGGKAVLPGLYDSHSHGYRAAGSELGGGTPDFKSIVEVQDYLRKQANEKPAGQWIVVRRIYPTRMKEGRLPTKAELDDAAPQHPVLWNAGPVAMVNSAALSASNITKDTPNPGAGVVVKDAKTGEPTGLLREAESLLKGVPPAAKTTPEERRRAVLEMFNLYNQYGITAIADRGLSPDIIDGYRKLSKSGDLTLRVDCTRVVSASRSHEENIKTLDGLEKKDADGVPYAPTGVGDDWVRIGPLKVYMDGGMLIGTAYMREPWGTGPTYQIEDPAYRGLMYPDREGLRDLFLEAAKRGWQLTAHVAGDAAIEELLDVYDYIQPQLDISKRRMLLTHANFPTPEALDRCQRLGVLADVQPAWLYKDGDSLMRTLGERRMQNFHPLKDWMAHTTIGGGSDHMMGLQPDVAVNPWNPWLGIWIAVRRMTEFGRIINPEQALTREQAIRFYTINNAMLHFQEEKIGSLEPGKYADLILVDRDPLTCPVDDLRKTIVLLTMVNGKVVHERPN